MVVVMGGALAAWLALRGTTRTADAAGDAETVLVTRRSVATSVVAIGTVKAQIGAEVRVGSRISGRVRRLRANIGDAVRRGQVIAELETEELDAVVDERAAEAREAEARLAALEATAQLAAAELTRQVQLQREGVATLAEADVARERAGVADAQLAAGRRALERARAALASAEVQRSFTVLRSPIDGVVASVATQEGETIAAGLNAPTFLTVIDLGRLQVDAYVDEVDIGKVRVGQRAVFTVDAHPARDFHGTVAAIYPTATIQDNVVKYVAAVRIDSAGGLLRPEMTANVRITLEAREVLAIPARAVRREAGRAIVHVTDGRRTEPREVRLGWREGPWVEVVDGLREGDRVLLDAPAGDGGAR